MGCLRLGILLSGLALLNPVHAVEIKNISVSKSADRYTVELKMIANIPEAFAREVLEDPDRTVKVNTELVAVHHLPSEQPGVRRLRDHTRVCVWFFCVDYQNTLNMRILENRDIQLTIEPELSEFNYGVFTWRIEPLSDEQSRLIFHSVSTPGFWVPTTGLLKYRMRRGVQKMVRHMECEYHQDEECIDPGWEDSTLVDE